MLREFKKGENQKAKNSFGLFLFCVLLSILVYTFSGSVPIAPPAENEPNLVVNINNRS